MLQRQAGKRVDHAPIAAHNANGIAGPGGQAVSRTLDAAQNANGVAAPGREAVDRATEAAQNANGVAKPGGQAVDPAHNPTDVSTVTGEAVAAPVAAQNRNDVATPGAQTVDRASDDHQNANGVATPRGQVVDRALDAAQNPNDVATPGGQAVGRAPDEIEGAPADISERAAGRQTVGVAPVGRTADATKSSPPSRKPPSNTTDALWIAMVMPLVVVALGLFRFLFRRTYAKRLLAFGALRLRPPPHYLRLVEPLSRNEVEPDPGAASSIESVEEDYRHN